MNRISYSQVSLYNNCPRHWKLRYIDKISKTEQNIHLIFGTAMHEVLQHYLNVMYKETIKNANELDLDRMLMNKLKTLFIKAKEEDGKEPCTKKDITEFYVDGITILDWFKKHRGSYFSKKGYKLIGCEIPIEYGLVKELTMVGYLDVVIHDELRDVIKICDIKTSTMGWNKWMKRDENKTQQLLLYKQFYSKQYNHPIDKIEVEYFIVKRKLYENVDFPQKRVQKFIPASGTVSMNKVANRLNTFIDTAFNEDGSYTDKELLPTPSKKTCRFCEFNQTEYCSVGVK
jgi:hypothetical protein|tara:strand:- start:630 stop:1490 length:861 start_codon:yes stop_codon:yes gene_type:complete